LLRRYRVEGIVQGVGFRWFVQREAESLNLAGWVRNTTDGAVEVLAAGPAESLDLLVQHLSHGPKASRVTKVTQEPGVEGETPPTGPFRIR
jgi:acylphosphatase